MRRAMAWIDVAALSASCFVSDMVEAASRRPRRRRGQRPARKRQPEASTVDGTSDFKFFPRL